MWNLPHSNRRQALRALPRQVARRRACAVRCGQEGGEAVRRAPRRHPQTRQPRARQRAPPRPARSRDVHDVRARAARRGRSRLRELQVEPARPRARTLFQAKSRGSLRPMPQASAGRRLALPDLRGGRGGAPERAEERRRPQAIFPPARQEGMYEVRCLGRQCCCLRAVLAPVPHAFAGSSRRAGV